MHSLVINECSTRPCHLTPSCPTLPTIHIYRIRNLVTSQLWLFSQALGTVFHIVAAFGPIFLYSIDPSSPVRRNVSQVSPFSLSFSACLTHPLFLLHLIIPQYTGLIRLLCQSFNLHFTYHLDLCHHAFHLGNTKQSSQAS